VNEKILGATVQTLVARAPLLCIPVVSSKLINTLPIHTVQYCDPM